MSGLMKWSLYAFHAAIVFGCPLEAEARSVAALRGPPLHDQSKPNPRQGLAETRIDDDRPAGPFNCLIVLLQSEIGPGFRINPHPHTGVVRTEPNRLVKIFEALFKLPE